MVSGGNCWLNSCLALYFEDDDTALTVSPSLNTKGWTIGGKSKHVDYLEYYICLWFVPVQIVKIFHSCNCICLISRAFLAFHQNKEN